MTDTLALTLCAVSLAACYANLMRYTRDYRANLCASRAAREWLRRHPHVAARRWLHLRMTRGDST